MYEDRWCSSGGERSLGVRLPLFHSMLFSSVFFYREEERKRLKRSKRKEGRKAAASRAEQSRAEHICCQLEQVQAMEGWGNQWIG